MALLHEMAVKEVGEIVYLNRSNINWVIPKFSMLPWTEGTRIWSPKFYFCNGSFPLALKEKGVHEFSQYFNETPKEYVGLFISSADDILYETTNCYRIGVADEKNEVINCSFVECIKTVDSSWIGESRGFYGVRKLFNKEQVHGRYIFRLFCEMNSMHERQQLFIFPHQQEEACETTSVCRRFPFMNSNSSMDSFQRFAEKCVTGEPPKSNKSKSTVGNVAKKAVDDNECNDMLLKNCSSKSGDINRQEIKNLVKLSQNLLDLYVEGKDSDLTIKVKDREFKAHRAILRARSSVFDAMFSHDLSETNSGVVPIEDCEPGSFEEFLYFVYTGKTRNISCDNMCELYYVSDKYDLAELKEECISFLQKSLSIETICDVICLSIKHNEAELLELAIVFFARNMDDILVTNKWQLFLKENPIAANELCIKALKIGFRKMKI